MKKMLLTFAVAISAATSANAADYTYECSQVRTTAEEAVATTKLKSTLLTVTAGIPVLSNSSIQISIIDDRLLAFGAPIKHTTMGGYLTSTANEVFLCERPL